MQGKMQRDHQGNKGNIDFRRTLKEMQRKSKGNSKEIERKLEGNQSKCKVIAKEFRKKIKGNAKGVQRKSKRRSKIVVSRFTVSPG